MKKLRNHEVRGDDKPMTDKGSSHSGDYQKSLGEASKSDMMQGFINQGKIIGDTKSDKGMS